MASKIEIYRDLENQIQTQVDSGNYNLVVFQLTTQLLRLNPEYYTIWNIRRGCLLYTILSRSKDQPASNAQDGRSDEEKQDSDESSLHSELSFAMPLLIKSPKCYWIWNYRWWILSQTIRRLSVQAACTIWEVELGLTSKMLDRDQRNFHAWGYRRAELQRRGGEPAFLGQELDTVREGLNLGPEDQSLWYYHQFLMLEIIQDGDRDNIAPALTVSARVAYMKHEIYEIKDLLEDYINVKWIYQALLEYTLSLRRLEKRSRGDNDDAGNLRAWLEKLVALDPTPRGRWNDFDREIGEMG
ncbi:Geranylgeranyl transferase type-2 subunit alpha [Beauveria bassiana]|uniref:Geranylgeranyl transferase type-2 subunit alpha n=1 Tax=Beauveria bassiana TaxID=176275 RepID=A0A2N6NGF9_BEABA|nr:Geranylgeranyl transferase type-2 subunit alpha [Beauveria bassiana]